MGAPESILRRLDSWIAQAEHLVTLGKSAPVGAPPQLGPGQVGGGAQSPQLANMASLPLPGLQ
jgi:hypothetical protein